MMSHMFVEVDDDVHAQDEEQLQDVYDHALLQMQNYNHNNHLYLLHELELHFLLQFELIHAQNSASYYREGQQLLPYHTHARVGIALYYSGTSNSSAYPKCVHRPTIFISLPLSFS
jgi:alanine racemase